MVYTLKRRNIPAEQYSARILFSLKKDENSDTCFSTNFEDIVLSEISQSRKVKYCMIHLHEGPRVVRLRETESEWWFQGRREEEMESCHLMGIEFQVCERKEFC